MKYTIKGFEKKPDIQTQNGTFAKYQLVLDDGAGNDMIICEMLQKPETPAPEKGASVEGTIEDTQYGKKFKKERPAGSFGGGFKNDPETRKEIIRQNALTNAVAFCTAKANLMSQKEAIKYLSGKQIVEVADYFRRFSEGKITIVTERAAEKSEVVTANDETPSGVDNHVQNEQSSTQSEVDIDEIPF